MSKVRLCDERALEPRVTAARHNDISEQMRNIARQMTPEEIDAVARYCGSQAAH